MKQFKIYKINVFLVFLGIQYHQYRILEFAPQKTRVPNQKLSIRSAEMHIRIEKQHNEWNSKSKMNLEIQQLMDSKRRIKYGGNVPRQRIKIWVFRMTEGINITEKVIEYITIILSRICFDS